jgi:gliding motility-associated-like protein
MKNWPILPLLFLTGLLFSQNLVPNPGFDVLSECPYAEHQIHFAYPWVKASNLDVDLYNECSTTDNISVPNAGSGYQVQRSGGGYADIYVYCDANIVSNSYIQTPLMDALKKNKQYYLEFYVSPDIDPNNYWTYTDAVGLAFSDTLYFKEINANGALPLIPAIENRGTLISDTIGWTRVSGCYTAKGGEEYAIIGNFRTPSETMVLLENPNNFPNNSYLYLEDVFIGAFDPLPDTVLLCNGAPKVLNAKFLDAKYQWLTGQTDSAITVVSAGLYIVQAIMDKCVLYDTVQVLDTRDYPPLPVDPAICSDEPIKLTAPLFGTYSWSSGSTEKTITVGTSGYYTVTITNECGEFNFSTQVSAKDCACNVYVPTAISPDGDGINDELRAYVGCDYGHRILRFQVFDRWGGQIYSTAADEEIAWDGSARGKPATPGLYAWVLEYEVTRNGKTERKTEKGEVSIMR